jgi:hypothetical protein
VVDNRNNVLGMITRKDIPHHALDEALLRLHAQSSGTTGDHGAGPSAAVQRLVSLDQETAIAANERTRAGSIQHELQEHVAARGSE